MYVPSHFEESNESELLEFIETFPLASIVTYRQEELDSNLIPLFPLKEKNGETKLLGHVARSNTFWQESFENENVLAIFRGPDSYISPNWYPGKESNKNQVPTWNYQVINVHGSLEIIDNPKFVRGVVARLVTKHERDLPKPWRITDSDKIFIEDMIANIVGIRISIKKVVGKFKLSQNRTKEDRLGVASQLANSGKDGLCNAMRSEEDKRHGAGKLAH